MESVNMDLPHVVLSQTRGKTPNNNPNFWIFLNYMSYLYVLIVLINQSPISKPIHVTLAYSL